MGEIVGVGVSVKVCLREDYRGRDAICLACHENAVQKRQLDFGKIERDDDVCHVYVCRDDMGLLREIRGFPDQIVLPVDYPGNDRRMLKVHGVALHGIFDLVSDGYRVSGLCPGKADLPAKDCGKLLPLRKGRQKIVAACVQRDRSSACPYVAIVACHFPFARKVIDFPSDSWYLCRQITCQS